MDINELRKFQGKKREKESFREKEKINTKYLQL